MSDEDDKSGLTINLPFSGKVLQTLPVEDRRAILQPFIAFGKGFGKFLERKFEKWNEEEQGDQLALMADAVSRAGEPTREPNRKNVSKILDSSLAESDANIRELWTNLLANEIASGTHPDFIAILERMNHEDAFRLLKIAQREGFAPKEEPSTSRGALTSFSEVSVNLAEALNVLLNLPWQKILVDGILHAAHGRPTTREQFIDEHLLSLQLIRYMEKSSFPRLTYTGKEFLMAVSDPSLVVASKEMPSVEEASSGDGSSSADVLSEAAASSESD